jgi:hypothetical protein
MKFRQNFSSDPSIEVFLVDLLVWAREIRAVFISKPAEMNISGNLGTSQ